MLRIAIFAAACLVMPAAMAQDALQRASQNGCLDCHAVDKKLVGPAWKDVAKKYAGDASAEARLVEKVKKGGSGIWGAVPMPPNVTVSDEDVRVLVKYVLSLK